MEVVMMSRTGPGWQARRNGREYFYRRVQLPDGTRVRKYFGRGMKALIETMRRDDEIKERQAFLQEQQQSRNDNKVMDDLHCQVDTLITAELLTAGYHNPNGRGWRLKRMKAQTKTSRNAKVQENPEPPESTPEEESTKRMIGEIVEAVKNGDESSIPDLREAMRLYPQLYQTTGDLATRVKLAWINRIARTDLHRRECLLHTVGDMRRELLKDGDSKAEQMLVAEIVAAWLLHHFHCEREALLVTADERTVTYLSKRSEASQKRYLRAIECLAKYRALMSKCKPVATADPADSTAMKKNPRKTARVAGNRISEFFTESALN